MRTIDQYPHAFHIALDGNGINGLEGMAGVCLFLFDPQSNDYAYKIAYYDGIAAGHAVSVNPSGRVGFLGNAGQHLLFYDAKTLDEVDRVSTLRFETPNTSLQGSTHLAWLDDNTFITAIGKHFYRFDLNDLANPERCVPHGVKLPHAMKITASGRYLCYGSMDNPAFGRRGEAKHVGVLDLETDKTNVITLPTTCWHLVPHESDDKFYCVSFRVAPTDGHNYHEWAMAFLKEYVYEIDATTGQVLRHWAAGREIPAHINSDVTLSADELIFCNGASQSVVLLDRASFAKFRVIDERPDLITQFSHGREVGTQVYDILARGNLFTNSNHILGALRTSRFTFLDSIYACQIDRAQNLIYTANRGLNHITLYDYPSLDLRLRVSMPEIQEYLPWIEPNADPRLGFHHGFLIG